MSDTTEKEKIDLMDFLKEAITAWGGDISDLDEDTRIHHECSECGKYFSESDKFCSVDGKEIIEKSSTYLSEDTRSYIIDLIYSFSNDCPENFGYTYVTNVEKRGDGSGYHDHFIFQRKSDDKYFVWYSYDGRVETFTLEECEKVVTTSWDFERYFD